VVHHAVFDGWSGGVLVRELAALYRAEADGQPPGLDELPIQFGDYAVWERDRIDDTALADLKQYWRQALADIPVVAMPTDRPRPVLEEFDGALAARPTAPGLLDALKELSRREGTTMFTTVMTAMAALLSRYTSQDDIVVGTVSANRTRSELAPLIGFLVNTLPIRANLSGDPPFTDLLARVKDATTGAYTHQDLPFGKIVEAAGVERDPGRSPVFQIMLTYAEHDTTSLHAAGVDFTPTELLGDLDAVKFDLDVLAEARTDGLWLDCSYKTGLFDPATIDRLLGHLETLLTGAVTDPSTRLSALPLLTPAERHRELVEWNDTAMDIGVRCVHHSFEAQAAATPDAIAAEYEDQQLTYAQLDRWATRIATRLAGAGPESLVGVCMPAGLARLAALIGIWKAGAGYVPLDPALPPDRLAFMITDTAMTIILTDLPSAPAVPPMPRITVITLDDHDTGPVQGQDTGLDDWDSPATGVTGTAGLTPANVAYVIYTSGSTGPPKGVMVEHRQAANFVHGMISAWQIGPDDTFLGFAAFTFDASIEDMFVPLLAGARIVLAPLDTLHSPPRLVALIRDRHITYASLPPAVIALLPPDESFPHLRILMAGGEELPTELARRWIRPGLRLVNSYGPTETTVTATYHELDAGTPMPPAIGLPYRPNYRAYVLDPDLNPVPVGVTGELHIGGAGVARGYLRRPDLTKERFIPDPFTPGQRLYKTGDLVRRRPDGTIVFLGRTDHQVKIRGLRIELGEIEAALTAHPAITQAILTLTTSPKAPAGDPQLTAYARPEPGKPRPTSADLNAHLARTLPAYMIPAHYILLDAFPLNSSGKIDRAALPPPPATAPAGQHISPATLIETMLADMYATLLHHDRVGVTDSFFDLGGNSLQAMRLVAMISERTGTDVGVATVFLLPTPRQLAARIDAIRSGTLRDAGSDPLVALSGGPGDLPLFMIHAIGGTVFAYAELARELASTFGVTGLQAPALAGADGTAASLTALVSDYTERIRAAQPTGPYRLAGWSMGGIVAYEIARRLEQAGAEVGLLVMLDAPFALPASPGEEPAEDPAHLAGTFVADVACSLGWDAAERPDPAASSAEEQFAWLAGRLGDRSGETTAQLADRFGVFQAHVRMMAGYAPAAPGPRAPALIVSAAASPNAPSAARWHDLLSGPNGSVSMLRMDSDHYAFLRPPLVAEAAASILKWHDNLDG
jgi:amino acid adenylation domain-containing protein